jgi:hypothetical protein
LLDNEHILVGRVVVFLALLLQDLERTQVELGRVGGDAVDRGSAVTELRAGQSVGPTCGAEAV